MPGIDAAGAASACAGFVYTMSTGVDGALDRVLALIADECADRATRRVLLGALAGTVEDELRRLDGETGSEAEAATTERKERLTALQYRIAAMLDPVPAAAGKG